MCSRWAPAASSQGPVAVEREDDPVLDLQACLLARVLDRVDDLPFPAVAQQVVVDRELERHGMRSLALDAVALGRARIVRIRSSR